MSAPRFVAWGELLWDLLPSGPRLGGAPANAAYHALQAGADVALISRVGQDDWGERAVDACASLNLNTDLIQRDAGRPTGKVQIIATVGDEPVYDIRGGVAWEHIELTPSAAEALEGAEIFCFGTLAQRVEVAGCEAALARLDEGCLRLCDLNLRPGTPRALIDWAIQRADALKINEVEYEILRERLGVEALAEALFAQTPVRLLAVTRGAEGCEIWTKEGAYEQATPPTAAEGGDPIGAGDAFTAIFSVSLIQGWTLQDAAARASRYAALIAGEISATPASTPAMKVALRPRPS